MRTILLSLLLGILATSCGDGKSSKQENSKQQEAAKEEKLEQVVYNAEKAKAPKAYLKVSECLIASNPSAAQTYAKRLKTALAEDGNESVKNAIDQIIASEDIAIQRKSFEVVTEYFYEVAKNGEAGMDIYLVHCPMAFDNTGANWLSGTNEVVNPYFGDQMLHCGRVMETLKGK